MIGRDESIESERVRLDSGTRRVSWSGRTVLAFAGEVSQVWVVSKHFISEQNRYRTYAENFSSTTLINHD